MWALMQGVVNLSFQRLLTLMNLSSAADVTLNLSFLRQSSSDPVSSQHASIFVTKFKKTFKVLKGFWND